MWLERGNMDDDPFMFALNFASQAATPISHILRDFVNLESPNKNDLMASVHQAIVSSTGSRCVVYRSLNPGLVVHKVYRDRHALNDRLRMAFTNFRVSGHSLGIETGRWNRRGRGRLPVEERLCGCGEVQRERHVIEDCPISEHVRQMYAFSRVEELFDGTHSIEISCQIISDILKLYV